MRALLALLIAGAAWPSARGETHLLFGDATAQYKDVQATCVNDDYGDAIAWITPLEDAYNNPTPDNKSLREVEFYWTSYGFHQDFAFRSLFGPVRDYTWETLPIIMTRGLGAVTWKEYKFQQLGPVNIISQFELNFSFLGKSDAQIYFCSQATVKGGGCVVFTLGGWEGEGSIMRRCGRGDAPMKASDGWTNCEELVPKVDHSVIFSEQRWSQISIRLTGRTLNVIIDGSNVLEYHARDDYEFNLYQYIFIHSFKENAFWKYHAYVYHELRQWSLGYIDSIWFYMKSTQLCVSFLANYKDDIEIEVRQYVDASKGLKISSELYASEENNVWNYKTFNAKLPQEGFYLLRINYNKENRDLVALKNVVIHDDCQSGTARSKFHSSKLTYDKNAEVFCSSLRNTKRLSLGKVGNDDNYCASAGLCDACTNLYQDAKCPFKMTCDQGNCYCSKGFTGEYCERECEKGKFGFNCAFDCGKCRDDAACDPSTGLCSSGCKNNYLEPKCVDADKPVLTGIYKIEDNCINTCTIILYQDVPAYNGKQTPNYFYLNLSTSDGTPSLGAIFPLTSKELKVSHLDKNTQYSFQVVLCTNAHEYSCNKDDLETFRFNTTCEGLKEDQIVIESLDKDTNIKVIDLQPSQCDLDSYRVSVTDASNREVHSSILIQHFVIRNKLDVFTNYSLNLYGNGQNITKQFCTDEAVPGAVQNIKYDSTAADQVTITWDEPQPLQGVITHYYVQWRWLGKVDCSPGKNNAKPSVQNLVTTTHVELTALLPYSNYEVIVIANTKKGRGAGKSVLITTQASDLFELEAFKYSLYRTADSIKLNWTVDCANWNSPLLLVMNATCLSDWCAKEVASTSKKLSNYQMDVVLTPLQAYTAYLLEMYLFYGIEKSANNFKSIVSKNVTTLSSTPGRIPFAEVYAIWEQGMSVRWSAPYPPTGELDTFRIQYRYISKWSNGKLRTLYSKTSCKIWTDMYCLTLTGLDQGYKHEIFIAAHNKEISAYGLNTVLSEVTIIKNPNPPLNIKEKWDASRFLILQWQHPNRTNAPYVRFRGTVNGQQIDYYAAENFTYTYNTTFQCTPQNHYANGNLRSVYNTYKSSTMSFNFNCPVFEPSFKEDPVLTEISENSLTIFIPSLKDVEVESNLYVIILTNQPNKVGECKSAGGKQLQEHLKMQENEVCWIVARYAQENYTSVAEKRHTLQFTHMPQYDLLSEEFRVGVLIVNEFANRESSRWYDLTSESDRASGHAQPRSDDPFNFWWLAIVACVALLLATVGFLWYTKPLWLTGLLYTPTSGTYSDDSKPDLIPLNPQQSVVMPLPSPRPPVPAVAPKNPPAVASKPNSRAVTLADFYEYVKAASLNGELQKQHEKHERGLLKPHACGKQTQNYPKNRYKNLIAYDHTRVKLKLPSPCSGPKPTSDYINANYIKGGTCEKAFIATQGPIDSTIYDFWCMVLAEGVQHIVMLANLVETGKKKVSCYWPDFKKINKVLKVEDITITADDEKTYYNFIKRTFVVTRGDVETEVTHHHFTNWPDHGVPMYPQSLIPFVEDIRAIPHSSDHPILVHCSAGVGRTGTIILIDICLRQALQTNQVDIFREYGQLRGQRANLVDNVEQYKLAHLVLLEYFSNVKTTHSTDDFEAFHHALTEQTIAGLFAYVSESAWQEHAFLNLSAGLQLKIEADKNRDPEIVPSRYGFLYLRPTVGNDSSYINAVSVDGFDVLKKFIATQHPLENTVDDFWRLVVGEEIKVVVSLQMDYDTEFWKNGGDFMSTGRTLVEHIEYAESLTNFVHDLHVTLAGCENQPKNAIKLIELKDWNVGDMQPTDLNSLILLWKEVKNARLKDSKVLVVCRNGASACGLFIALTNILDRMESEQVIDVCMAVRIIRRSRPQFVTTVEQLEALYRLVALHLSEFELYSNFSLSKPAIGSF